VKRWILLLGFAGPAALWAQTPGGASTAPDPVLQTARQAFVEKDYARAQKLYQALAEKGADPALWIQSGNCDIDLDRPAEACAAFEKALALKPDIPGLAAFIKKIRSKMEAAAPPAQEASAHGAAPSKNHAAPSSGKYPAFGFRFTPALMAVNAAAYAGDSAELGEQTRLYHGSISHRAKPPQATPYGSLELYWRLRPRWEIGLEAGWVDEGKYDTHIVQPRPLNPSKVETIDQDFTTSATPLALNFRWRFHLGPKGTDFHLLLGGAYYPVRITYHRAGQDLPSFLHPLDPTDYPVFQQTEDGVFRANRWGLQFGLGTDLSLGGHWSLNPSLRWRVAKVANFTGTVTTVNGAGVTKTHAARLYLDWANGNINALNTDVEPGPAWAPMEFSFNGLEAGLGVSYGL